MDETTRSTEKELDEFRSQWRQEVASRQHQQKRLSQSTAASDIQTLSQKTNELSLQDNIHSSSFSTDENLSMGHKTETLTSKEKEEEEVVVEEEGKNEEKEEELSTAMDYYIKAIDHEREGKLGKALNFYRHAFRLNRDIDFAYKKHYQTHIAPLQQHPQHGSEVTITSGEQADGSFRHIVPIGIEYDPSTSSSSTTTTTITTSTGKKFNKTEWKDPLHHLIEEFSQQDIEYVPILDYKPVLISKLPNEILMMVFKKLCLKSISSSSQIALVCKRFFLLTRSPTLWRYLCEHSYRPPHLSLEESKIIQLKHVQQHYNGSWLRMYIERPRIRYDGIYIATCHYTRHGMSDTSWNQPIHLVTYYRYLRFFTDGRILKYVSTEEPSQVVKLLNQNFTKRQTLHGKFQWQKDRENNDEPVIKITAKSDTLKNECFYLTLSVKGTHRGRHNKLGWKRYTSINHGKLQEQDLLSTYDYDNNDNNDIEHEYDLKLMKPYYFSPVRSYVVNYPNDF